MPACRSLMPRSACIDSMRIYPAATMISQRPMLMSADFFSTPALAQASTRPDRLQSSRSRFGALKKKMSLPWCGKHPLERDLAHANTHLEKSPLRWKNRSRHIIPVQACIHLGTHPRVSEYRSGCLGTTCQSWRRTKQYRPEKSSYCLQPKRFPQSNSEALAEAF